MKILIASERFLFRFGVDRVLLILAEHLIKNGHDVSLMASKIDTKVVEALGCQYFIVPECDDYLNSNEYARNYLVENSDRLFGKDMFDIALIAGWPFFECIDFFESKNVKVVFNDYGAVSTAGYSGEALKIQEKLRQYRIETLPKTDGIIAISSFIAESQSVPQADGKSPVQEILLGADHLDFRLWTDEALQTSANFGKVKRAMERTKKNIVLPGRWEPNSYKNVEHGLFILRELKKRFKSIKLYILADERDADIPKDLRGDVVPMGFLSDDEMKYVMQKADLALCVSLWEGFNLPLAESQYLGTPALAYDIGAHREVVMHQIFLCDSIGEMTEKASLALSGALLPDDIQKSCFDSFRDRFKWSDVCKRYEEFFRKIADNADIEPFEKSGRTESALLDYGESKGVAKLSADAMTKMKIIITSNIYPPNFIGGAELVAHSCALELIKQGHDVIVFAGELVDDYEHHTVRKTMYGGLTVHRVKLCYEDFDTSALEFIHEDIVESFRKVLSDFDPDVVHFHNMIGLSPKLIAAANDHGAKTAVTLHDYWGFCHKNTTIKDDGSICGDFSSCDCGTGEIEGNGKKYPIRFRRDFIRLMLSSADMLISPSRYLAGNYEKAGFENVRQLWNGIELARFSHVNQSKSDKVRFTFFGYMGDHKGVHLILEALQLLGRHKGAIQVNLAGEGHKLNEYKQLAEERGLPVKFLGKVQNEDVAGVYEITDVLILASTWPENQPVSITEAMACKIPAIVSDQGGNLELVKDGESGFLFELGSAEDLADKMKRFVLDRGLSKKMGKKAYEIIKEFDVSKQVERLAEMYFGISKRQKIFNIATVNDADFGDETIKKINGASSNVLYIFSNQLPDSYKNHVREVLVVADDAIKKMSQEQISQPAKRSIFKRCIIATAKGVYKMLRGTYRIIPIPRSLKERIRNLVIRGSLKLKRSMGYEDPVVLERYAAYEAAMRELSLQAEENRLYVDTVFQVGKKSDDFVEFKENKIVFTDEDVKPIACYLTQFHAIPENDEWWGKGFTEWTNVAKTVPHFPGHYQPHLPLEMFYDLSNVDAMRRQVELAKNYGIYGFMFHYYWFGGRRLLEKPFEEFLRNKADFDFPFCINWANHNWTRIWDTNEDHILIKQVHSEEDDLAFIANASDYFRDERYIRAKGKPLISVFNPTFMPNSKKTIGIWRDYCMKNGIGEIHVVGMDLHMCNPFDYGFDGAIAQSPHDVSFHAVKGVQSSVQSVNGKTTCTVIDAEKYVREKMYLADGRDDFYRGITTTFDNSARRSDFPYIFPVTPKLYKEWLGDLIADSKKRFDRGNRFVVINAWNEWAEGMHLEPDRRNGYAYLQATADAIAEASALHSKESRGL